MRKWSIYRQQKDKLNCFLFRCFIVFLGVNTQTPYYDEMEYLQATNGQQAIAEVICISGYRAIGQIIYQQLSTSNRRRTDTVSQGAQAQSPYYEEISITHSIRAT